MVDQKAEREPKNNMVWIVLLIASVVANVVLGGALIVFLMTQSTGVSGSMRFEAGVAAMQSVCNDPEQRQKLYFGQDQYDATGRAMTSALIDYECDWALSDTSKTFADGYNAYLKQHGLPPADALSQHVLKK
jgi:hypothetical protein